MMKKMNRPQKMNSVCDLSRDLNISNAIYFEGATMVGNIVSRFINFYMD